MKYCLTPALLAALLLGTASLAQQTPAPVDANARVPQLRHDSAFSGYQPYREQAPAAWRALNDEAHKAGGHVGIVGGARGTPGKPAPHPLEHKK